MSLGGLPPWLEIHPSDFVRAAQMGAEAGLQVARMNQAAQESAAARAQRADESAADRALRQFEHQQQMELRAQEIAAEREKSKDAMDSRMAYNMANLGLRQSGMAETQARDENARKRWEREQIERERHNQQMETQASDRTSRPMTDFQKAEVAHWNRVNTPKPDPFDVQDRAKVLGRMAEIVRELDENPAADDRKRLVDEWVSLRDKQTEIDKKYAAAKSVPDMGAVPPPGPAGPPPGPAAPEVAPKVAPTIPSPGVPPMAAPSFRRAPVDPEEREAGTVYMTSKKGPALWNGKAWEPYTPGMPTEPTAQEYDSSIPDPGADSAAQDAEPVPPEDTEEMPSEE